VAAGRAQYRGLETPWFEIIIFFFFFFFFFGWNMVLFRDDRTRLFCRWRATPERLIQ